MSELIVKNNRVALHLELFVTVSALALMTSICVSNAADDDGGRPTVWIEVGGQLQRIDSAQSIFAPSFFDHASPGIIEPMVQAQKQPNYGLATEGKITFAPENSNWILSAGLRYGRANGGRHLHHESAVSTATQPFPSQINFVGDGKTSYHDSSLTADFQAGRDVGLGMFGSGGKSVVSAGVRFAQFNSSSDIGLIARPYVHNSPNAYFPSKYNFRNRRAITYNDTLLANRSTHAIGPSLSWDASAPLVGNGEHATLDFDWGVNASVLFGRQKVQTHLRTSIRHSAVVGGHSPYATYTAHSTQSADLRRSRKVTVPNVGGFAGFSFRYADAKVSFGYRADFFFGAMDSGIDSTKSSTIGFYGPFATISMGLGG